MTRDPYQYGHDIHGAITAGYIRRARAAATACIKNAAGWMQPMNPNDMSGGDFAIQLVIEGLLSAGHTPEDIVERLNLEVKNIAYTVDDVERASRREPSRAGEDPFDRWHDGYDWDEYDAYVDAMTDEGVRMALKREARIRAQAQAEALTSGPKSV